MKSVRRAISVLELLAAHPGGLGLSRLAALADLPPSTAHRILKALRQHRLAHQDEDGLYRPGYGLLHLAASVDSNGDLRPAARRHLAAIGHRWQECVFLTVLVDGRAVAIDVLEAHRPDRMRFFVSLGQVMPLHAAASAKALLAFRAPEERERLLGRHPLEALTSRTITDPDAVARELERVRQREYAFCRGEVEMGVDAVAVPVLDDQRTAAASLTVVAPAERLAEHMREGLVEHLREEAHSLATELGLRRTARRPPTLLKPGP